MIEFKIRFKSGDVGYFKPASEITTEQADRLIEYIGEGIRNEAAGIFKVSDSIDDTATVINIKEIATIGYRVNAK